LKSGADNVILLLDACRTEGDRADGLGIGDEQPGAITIFSCQRNQKAYEIAALEQGAFTAALLEGLQMPKASDNCATVQRLDAYLQRRVPELCRLHPERPVQTPVTSVDPGQKWYLLLLPEVATEPDIAMLKVQAYQAADLDDLKLAEYLWIRIIAATNGQDLDALRAYANITNRQKPLSSRPPPPQTSPTKPLTISNSPVFHAPVRLIYENEGVRQIGFQPTQPTKVLPSRSIPWISLIILGLLCAVYGMLLTSASAHFSAWIGVGVLVVTIAVAVTTIAAGTGAIMAVAIVGALTGVLVFPVPVAIETIAETIIAVAVFVAVFETVAGRRLLISFSQFHAFLILAGTSLGGLGVGWLGTWAFKAASGH
jgi:hypothetical protein